MIKSLAILVLIINSLLQFQTINNLQRNLTNTMNLSVFTLKASTNYFNQNNTAWKEQLKFNQTVVNNSN